MADSHVLCGGIREALKICKYCVSLQNSLKIDHKTNYFAYITNPVHTIYNYLLDAGLENDAYDFALNSLFNSYELPKGEYAQNRVTHRCEKLVTQLEKHDLKKSKLKEKLLKYSREHLKYLKKQSDSVDYTNRDILPNHCFVRYVFDNLVNFETDLAFDFGLYFLPINLKKTAEIDDDDFADENLSYNGTTCEIQSHVEHQQGELAATILKRCIKNPSYLKLTLTSILEDVKQPSQLIRLAKICQGKGLSERNEGGETSRSNSNELLGAGFELGVRCVRLVSEPEERKVCIRWLVACAVDTGRHAVEFLIRNWADLFEPKEVCNDVAPLLTSQPVIFHLKLTLPTHLNPSKDEFTSNIRNMVIEACIKDPVPCILFALTLCEEDTDSFELICQIIYDSSNRFNTAQLFSIARYLEGKKHLQKSLKTGIQALKKLDIGPSANQHPAICDVLWLSSLACTLGMNELTQVVPIIENCIHNPLLLTEIAQRCDGGIYANNTKTYSCHEEPLNRLVASAQKLFVQDIETKLRNITRKNYSDFTKYLQKIQRAFLLAEDGADQFHWLVDYIMTSQKGKKKLHKLISQTFFL